jgi:ABC-type phosphate transport system auxiliary subunit
MESPSIQHTALSEYKKAEIDAFIIKELNAQKNVEQFQAIVNSLTEKSNAVQSILVIDERNRTKSYNNLLLVNQLAQTAKDLLSNSKIAFDEISLASAKTNELAPDIKIMVDKLIYSSEIINKLSNIIIRKKALNPLISDDLLTMVSEAGTDANNAVALSLIALKSAFVAQASNLETEMTMALEMEQAQAFYELLIGNSGNSLSPNKTSLVWCLNNAFHVAQNKYAQTEKANEMVIKQLNDANSNLNKAQVKLRSIQSGLAALIA